MILLILPILTQDVKYLMVMYVMNVLKIGSSLVIQITVFLLMDNVKLMMMLMVTVYLVIMDINWMKENVWFQKMIY